MSPERIAEVAVDTLVTLSNKLGGPKQPPWKNMSLADKAALVDDILMLQKTEHRGLWGLDERTGVLYALACLLKDKQ